MKLISILFGLILLGSLGCKQQAKEIPVETPQAAAPAAVEQAQPATTAAASPEAAGKEKYDIYCATCHGTSGTGDGPAAQALNPQPRNHQDPAFQKSKTDADIAKVIKDGGASVGLSPTMPAWGGALSDTDIQNVVAYIRQLGKSAAK